jgi:hypothetical protein
MHKILNTFNLSENLHKILFVLSIMMFLSACTGGIKGSSYLADEPKLDLKQYFSGNIDAWGIVQDRSGNVIKRFDVKMLGVWKDNEGTLEEFFQYSDGTTQTRIWKIKQIGKDEYEGFADDILGKATGRAFGNAVNWSYSMDLPVDGTTYRIKFDDWMWLMKDGVLINRSYMKKFGVTVGEITIFMKKS